MSLDASLVGVVFSFILLIIFFSSIILYLTFRIKEAFREEQRRSVLLVKIVLLIGALFLAGGILYFFGNMLRTPTPPTPTEPVLNMTTSYPSSANVNTEVTVTFTVTNPSGSTAQGSTIQAEVILTNFEVQSSTHEVVGNVINIGDVPPGTTIVSLELMAPSRPGKISGTVNLTYQEMTEPITQEITISVKGGP